MCGMHEWLSGALTREKNARMLAEAEERRLARLAPRKSFWRALRTRVARGMFGFAVALEREETWRAVRQKLEAPRR
jgi:hypothetical protein